MSIGNAWDKLSNTVKRDLKAWFNQTKLSDSDRELLARLYEDVAFHAWNCIKCGDRCYWGEPTDWADFQGVSQLDFVSYPGFTSSPFRRSRMCDHCRMHDTVPDAGDLKLVGRGEPSCWAEGDVE